MKKNNLFFNLMLLASMFAIILTSCEKDPDPVAPTLVSCTAGTVSINEATPPTDVVTDAVIKATFSTLIDPATAIAANISLTRASDDVDVELTISVTGKEINITPVDELYSGESYTLTLGSGIKSTDGLAFTEVTRSFTTLGTFVPTGMIAYWNFEDNANDQIGTWNPKADGVIDITYVSSRNADAGKAAQFNGTTSIIEYANGDDLITTSDFTMSFWMKATEASHGHFVMGIGTSDGYVFELASDFKWFKVNNGWHFSNDLTRGISDLDYNGDGMTKDNGGWRATTVNKANASVDASLKDMWAHIVYTFNSTTKERSLYLNGVVVKTQDFDLFIADDGTPYDESYIDGMRYIGVAPDVLNELALGFIQSRGGTKWDNEAWGGYDFETANHFKGLLDDIRIFHIALSAEQINLMYNSEK